jgi:PAS domain S-box-containing protein
MVLGYNNSFIKLPYIALKWFLGHSSSYILITPLIIYWQSTSFVRWSVPKTLEFLLLLLFLVIIIFTIFSGRFSASVIFFSPYVIGPFLLWSIIRFSNRVLTLYLTVISLIAIVSTINGNGPFYRESLYGTQILLQGFLFILYLSTFLLYATISELREAKNVLKTYKEELEVLVEKRSEEINQKNKRLEEEIEFRIKTEKRLRQLSQAVEQSPAAVIITDKNGIIVYANPKFIEIRGYKQQDVIGKNPSLFKSGVHDQKFYKNLWGTILKGKIWKGEILNKKKNGQLFWESALISPILNEEGEIHNFVGIYEDISKQKEAEDEIEKYINKLGESEYQLQLLNQNKDKFFSILAHDLKGPFSSLLGFSEFLVHDFEELTLKEIKSYSINIHESTKNTYKLLENLLEWGRVQRNMIDLEFENINLLEIAKKTIELYSAEANKKKVKLELKIDKQTYVHADKNTIATVFRNLTSNAIKFCEAGDVITISSTSVNEGIEVAISDTGIGISEDDKAKLFRIDVHHTIAGTAQEKGTGLGLILCKDLLEKNNSEIRVESKLGKGTTFNFILQRSVD